MEYTILFHIHYNINNQKAYQYLARGQDHKESYIFRQKYKITLESSLANSHTV